MTTAVGCCAEGGRTAGGADLGSVGDGCVWLAAAWLASAAGPAVESLSRPHAVNSKGTHTSSAQLGRLKMFRFIAAALPVRSIYRLKTLAACVARLMSSKEGTPRGLRQSLRPLKTPRVCSRQRDGYGTARQRVGLDWNSLGFLLVTLPWAGHSWHYCEKANSKLLPHGRRPVGNWFFRRMAGFVFGQFCFRRAATICAQHLGIREQLLH